MNVFFFTEIAQPEGGEIAQIAEARSRREGHHLELVLEKIGLIGDLKGAAIVFGAADDHKCHLHLAVAGADSEAREGITEDLASALPPVGEDTDASLEAQIHGIDDHAVGSGAGNGKEEALATGIFERRGQTEGDVVDVGIDQAPRRTRDVPGKIEFLGENIGSSARKKSQGNAIAVAGGSQTVDNFIERAVASASDDQLATFADRLLRYFGSVAGAGGFGQFGFDAARGQNAPSLVEKFAAAIATIASVGVMDEKCVLERRGHDRDIGYREVDIVAENRRARGWPRS